VEQSRAEIVAWVGSHVLPHEGAVRAWLRRRLPNEPVVDDVVQEAYCRIAALSAVGHIVSGRAYFFRTASNILVEQMRRARIVRIDTVAEMEGLDIVDDEPSPERIVSSRRDLARVRALIEALPDRCRRVFELRRIHGLPQREVAEQLGVTENVVEQQSIRGLKLILKALTEEGVGDLAAPSKAKRHERARDSKRD
jgi:RNA polymerase sigma factor (sigma-70 family)